MLSLLKQNILFICTFILLYSLNVRAEEIKLEDIRVKKNSIAKDKSLNKNIEKEKDKKQPPDLSNKNKSDKAEKKDKIKPVKKVEKKSKGNDEWESSAVDVKIRKLAQKLAEVFDKLPGEKKFQRLAVTPFEESGETVKTKQLGKVVTSILSTSFIRDHSIYLVERTRLDKVIQEVELKQAGLTDPDAVGEFGQLLDAQALVIGQVMEIGDTFVITARIVSVKTAESLMADTVKIKKEGLITLASKSIVLKTKSGAAFRSALIPGWGQFFNGEQKKGMIFMGAEVLTLSGVAYFFYKGRDHENSYNTNAADVVDEKFEAQNAYQTANLFWLAAAVIHTFNVFDAYISGYDPEKNASLITPSIQSTDNGEKIAMLKFEF